MSRYIEYDAIDYRNDKMHDKSSDFIDGVIYMAQRIDDAPSIDIVRCKECKHGTYCEEAEMYICNANGQDLYEAEHFCSYGEREGE